MYERRINGNFINTVTKQEAQTQQISLTSKTLTTSAKFWMSFPLTYLLYCVLVIGLGPEQVLKVVLNPFYWFVCTICVLAGNGLQKIKWYGWYLFIFSNLLVFYETASVLTYYANNENRILIFLSTMLFQLLLMYLVAREVRVPYFFPRIRWWESDPRYKLSVPVRMFKTKDQEVEGEIMDISLGGCFVKTHAYYAQNEQIDLVFDIFERTVRCRGTVVWRTESKVTHPKGVGIKFNNLSKADVIILKRAQKRLTQLNRMYQHMSAERNWEEYLRREKRFQGTPSHEEEKKQETTAHPKKDSHKK